MVPADPAVIAQQLAEAHQAVQTLLHRAGPMVACIVVDEVQQTDWGKELVVATVDLAFSALASGPQEASEIGRAHV